MRFEEIRDDEAFSLGVQWEGQYMLDEEDIPMLFRILRSSLYSNKIQAVLREYMSNAWDEHQECGKSDVSIKVVLPTELNPTLIIRDYGRGLSHEQVDLVYRRYMKSLKRDSNSPIGAFGIGAKVAFAYSDTFTITSCHAGEKRVYVGVVTAGNAGSIELHAGPYPTEDSGVTIKVPVNPSDVFRFRHEAKRLLPFFSPMPEVNLDSENLPHIDKLEDQVGGAWSLRKDELPLPTTRATVWAKMGPVVYPVDTTVLEQAGLNQPLPQDRIMLFDMPIGSISPHPSRESLEYTERTTQALIEAVNSYVETRLAAEYAKLQQLPLWQKRMYAKTVYYRTGFEIGERKSLCLSLEDLKQIEAFATLKVCGSTRTKAGRRNSYYGVGPKTPISVHESTTLFVHNAQRRFQGYIDIHAWNKGGTALYFRRKGDKQTLLPQVQAALKGTPLEGIPILFTSDMTYTSYSRSSGRVSPQHKARFFSYSGNKQSPLSKSWDVEEEMPGEDDVFVILDRFEGSLDSSGPNFYVKYELDKQIARHFGVDMPDVYGVKRTAKHPVSVKDVKEQGAIPYKEWSERLRSWCAHMPEMENLRGDAALKQYSQVVRSIVRSDLSTVPDSHPLVQYRAQIVARRKRAALSFRFSSWVRRVYRIENIAESWSRLLEPYPNLFKFPPNERGAYIDFRDQLRERTTFASGYQELY